MGRITFDYLWITVVLSLAMIVISHFFPNLGGSSGFVTTVVAGMTTGQLYGQRTGEEVSSGFAWKTAAILTVVSLIFGGVVIGGFHMAGQPLLPPDLALSFSVLAIVLAFAGLIVLLVTRFAFRWGVKQGAKVVALKKDKEKAEIFD